MAGSTLINVTMADGSVVVRPVGRLDDDMLATIAQLLASADTAGTAAILDVSGVDPRDRAVADGLLAGGGQLTPASVA